jgi:two-component system OmpR family response regulator
VADGLEKCSTPLDSRANERTTPCLPAGRTRQGRRYLVAEDDPALRRLLVTQLRQDGAEVVEATGGADLLDWAERAVRSPDREVFDAIVSDIQMPDLTALDVLRKVPAVARSTPVILITAFGEQLVRDEAYDLGAAAVLRKPLHLADVHAIVRGVSRLNA